MLQCVMFLSLLKMFVECLASQQRFSLLPDKVGDPFSSLILVVTVALLRVSRSALFVSDRCRLFILRRVRDS